MAGESLNDQFAAIKALERSGRAILTGLLGLSALQFLTLAIVYGTLGQSSTDRLVFAGGLLAAGIALAVALAFWKSGAPTWKHKLAVFVIALPAASSLLLN